MAEQKLALSKYEPWDALGRFASGDRLGAHLLIGASLAPKYFPQQIDLRRYSPSMIALYKLSNDVYVHSDETRSRAIKEVKRLKAKNPRVIDFLKDMLPEIEEEISGEIFMRADGERFAVIYIDPRDNTLSMTDPTLGTYDSVKNSKAYEISSEGKRPIKTLHTHPVDSFISPPDFYQMLIPDNGGKRLINGQLVLCPTLQLMALVTNQTPLLQPEDAYDLVQYWKRKAGGEIEEGAELKLIVEQIEIARGAEFERILHKASNLVVAIKQTSISANAIRRMLKEVKKAQTQYEVVCRRYENQSGDAQSKFNLYQNHQLLQFARDIKVVLYISHNSADFYQFTA